MSVAIGVGAVTTEFSVVNGALLRGFSFPGSERLVDVRLSDPASIYPRPSDYVTTMADFFDLHARTATFDGMVAYLSGATINLTTRARAEAVEVLFEVVPSSRPSAQPGGRPASIRRRRFAPSRVRSWGRSNRNAPGCPFTIASAVGRSRKHRRGRTISGARTLRP